uniref:EGF-like domain-containing protein n=1 Tax=Magallana gigas TaxID=29159 RepID=A0A8W8P1N7_MAGGI
MLLFNVFRCLCLVVSFCVQCDGSLQPGFSKIQRGYRLNRKLIQSFSFLDCVVECLVTPRCKSVNYFKEANFCETNYENKTTANTKYEDGAGWVYSEKEHWPKEYELLALTELCEVIVKGCETSVYGSSCNVSCPTNCKENICHIQHGTCSACKPGWSEMHCNTKCREGWYGDNCSQQFTGHCIDGTTCNHVTGLCDGGCDTGWTGSVCDKECDDGTYGYNCVNNCSGHCLNGSICNKQHGHCDRGCDPGYTDNDCGKECVKSYGENCQYPCSQHCINQTCDRFTGTCLSWCQEGFYGQKCNHSNFESQKTEYVTSWIVAFSIVLFIVVLLITGSFVCFWVLYKRLFYGNKRLFWTSWFRENEITTTDKTTNYIEPNNYQDLNPVTNSSYQDLNPNTNSNYQTLNINTNYRELKLQYGEEEIQYKNITE